jgi:cardiolipin synthase
MLIALHVLIQAGLIVRALLRPNRDPASRVAWVAVILSLPILGILAYLLLGETRIGRDRTERLAATLARLPDPATVVPGGGGPALPAIPEAQRPLFEVGRSISGYAAVAGNHASLMPDSDRAIDHLVADIDAASRHVHLLFYIWLADDNGTKVARALMRAAARGVTCRAMVDDLGSRAFIKSPLWAEMGAAGVKLGRALQIGNPFIRVITGRIDLRNHRKIAVIDNAVTYCGSQNCADPAFRVKAKFAPWVDVVVRLTGPVVRQNQHLFAIDWMTETGEDLTAILDEPVAAGDGGAVAQVIASGPTARASAAPEMFESLMYGARRTLTISTPYYVPVDSIQAALRAAGNRGVDTTLILPARNDDFAVAAASRSYYEDLLQAGVKIHEYLPGLLHAKTMTVDGEVTLIGSANMDRRSFDLNYENNILLWSRALAHAMRERQQSYLDDSRPVTLDQVRAWGWRTRLWNNALAIVGPIL